MAHIDGTGSYFLQMHRLPPAFSDVPTDVEYAMQLISQRAAAGLDIKPVKRDRGTIVEPFSEEGLSQASEIPIDWKKWGNRLALGKSTVNDIFGNRVRRIAIRWKH